MFSLSFIVFLIRNSAIFYINIATSAFFSNVHMYILLYSLTFNLYESWVTYRQHIFALGFSFVKKIHTDNLSCDVYLGHLHIKWLSNTVEL